MLILPHGNKLHRLQEDVMNLQLLAKLRGMDVSQTSECVIVLHKEHSCALPSYPLPPWGWNATGCTSWATGMKRRQLAEVTFEGQGHNQRHHSLEHN